MPIKGPKQTWTGMGYPYAPYEHVLVRGKSVLNESGDRAPRGRARDGLAAGKKLETKPTSKRSPPNMSSWVRGDREWV